MLLSFVVVASGSSIVYVFGYSIFQGLRYLIKIILVILELLLCP